MRKTLSVICTALLISANTPLPVLAGQMPVSVVGIVSDVAGKPVTTAKVIIKDSAGKSLDEAATTSQGRYRLNSLTPGRYQLTLASIGAPFKEETVVANLGEQGLTVNWMVAAAGAAPIATAQPGTAETGGLFGIGDAWTVVVINVVAGGFGTGMAAAFGGFDSKKSKTVGSPSL